MKRIVAFIFLFGIAVLVYFGALKPSLDVDGLKRVCFVSSDASFEGDFIQSGSQIFVSAAPASAQETFDKLESVDGYSLYFEKDKNLDKLKSKFFDFCDQPYQVEGVTIFEGYTHSFDGWREKGGKRYNVQLAILEEEIVIGFPMILTGF